MSEKTDENDRLRTALKRVREHLLEAHPYCTAEDQAMARLIDEALPEEEAVSVDKKLMCCEENCEAPAEYQIVDPLDRDPISRVTDVCSAHVGPMLGHAVDVDAPAGFAEEWRVITVEAAA